MKTVRIFITGKVQGVFFRKYAFEEAINLGVDGFVMNTSEGNVMIEAAGEPEKVDALAEWCYRGSPKSEVKKVEITEIPNKEYQGFTIRY